MCKAHACGGADKEAVYLHILQAWLPELKGQLFGFQGKRLLWKMFQATSNLLDAEAVLNAQRRVHALNRSQPHIVLRPKCAQDVPFISTGRKPRLGVRLKLCVCSCQAPKTGEPGPSSSLQHVAAIHRRNTKAMAYNIPRLSKVKSICIHFYRWNHSISKILSSISSLFLLFKEESGTKQR